MMTMEEFSDFLRIRNPLLQKMIEVQYTQTKSQNEVQQFIRSFFEPVARTLNNDFLRQIKTNKMNKVFQQTVLQ